ncbi:protein adenylyltransferase SelO [Rothia terrae]|uniref:protein adenylyltransferase SelO n=1 Tax=Rothia terrae TaxID=396015 RepID=UPI003409ABC8
MKLENTYADAFPALAIEQNPTVPAESHVTWVNEPLAQDLGLDAAWLATDDGLAWLTGDSAPTYALAYSGFQFGQLSPVLGDGRAHLIGELSLPEVSSKSPKRTENFGLPEAPENPAHPRVDLHLKGSGLTNFSRPGSDGKAPLSAVWREVVIGESLHALGVPTSRALAVIETGEYIRRRSPMPEPAGILVRVASSHLRVGTFQYAQLTEGEELRKNLVNYALTRHYPHLNAENPLDLLRAVRKQQAQLVAHWMSLGFVHGVLNTDNVSISGQAIDFGPCAFIDGFSRDAVYSSIDRQGRYKYRNQPGVTQWNLARFAETLLDLIDDNPNHAVHLATNVLAEFEETYQDACTRLFAAKLGIDLDENADGETLDKLAAFIEKTLDALEESTLDFTGFFRALTDDDVAQNSGNVQHLLGQEPAEAWLAELRQLREETGTVAEKSRQLMENSNPVYIPRNLTLDAALRKVEAGDAEPIRRLIEAVRTPYTRRPNHEDLERTPTSSRFFTSFCGT